MYTWGEWGIWGVRDLGDRSRLLILVFSYDFAPGARVGIRGDST